MSYPGQVFEDPDYYDDADDSFDPSLLEEENE